MPWSFGLALLLALPLVDAGNNGQALTPPLSYRTWNQFSYSIDDALVRALARALVDTSRPVVGRAGPTSLLDLGFSSLGMDEGWAECGPFPTGDWVWHRSNADGSISPVVSTALFPDMRGLVDYIHSLGLKAGWYLNDCTSYCNKIGDTCGDECNAGDVAAWAEFGFDSLKLDGCSAQHNISLWASLLNATGTAAVVENCHNGANPDAPIADGGCPFYHMYRTSTDIRNSYGSWINNAQTVNAYLDGRSGPSCWSFADMSMVGVTGEINGAYYVPATFAEQRTHFGLWCILSQPLTLSLNLTNGTAVDNAWPIISNVAAIAVDQAWAGSHGGIFYNSNSNVTLQHCTPDWDGDMNCTWPAQMYYYKPMPNGSDAAVLVLNNDYVTALHVIVDFGAIPGLGCMPNCFVFDVWTQTSLGVTAGKNYTVPGGLGSHDSAFLVFSSSPWLQSDDSHSAPV